MHKQTEKEKELRKCAQNYAINCASAAYSTYIFGSSFESYEGTVTVMYSAGGHVGYKNHSKEFARNFLTPLYDVTHNTIIDNKMPFGVLADKMTVSHRTRHMMGIRIPIWDITYQDTMRDIYLRHMPICSGSGEDVTSHLLNSLNVSGFSNSYIREYLSGMSMDGQYTKLNIADHKESHNE